MKLNFRVSKLLSKLVKKKTYPMPKVNSFKDLFIDHWGGMLRGHGAAVVRGVFLVEQVEFVFGLVYGIRYCCYGSEDALGVF